MDQKKGILEGQSSGRHMGRILSQTVAQNDRRRLLLETSKGQCAAQKKKGLGPAGLVEDSGGLIPGNLKDIGREDLRSPGNRRPLAASIEAVEHPGRLGSLSGKKIGGFHMRLLF
jgi:hypothetical protein